MIGIKDYVGFDDKWLRLIGIPLIGLTFPLFFQVSRNSLDNLESFFTDWGIATVFALIYWEGTRKFFLYLGGKYPEVGNAGKKMAAQVSFIFVYAIVVHYSLDWLIGICFSMQEVDAQLALYVGILMTLAGGFFYEANHYYYELRSAIIEKESYKREMLRSELQGLKSQVNPHFLFNSLNTLNYLIPKDPKNAVRFVQKLSNTYRYILEMQDRELIAIQEELTFLEAYLFLLKERFEDNLQVTIDIPEQYLNDQILPLSLQMLFENALKHNEISTANPLHIKLFVENNRLVVRNNLQLKKQIQDSTKVGLENIKNRYHFFTAEKVAIKETEVSFTVYLPMLKIKQS